MSYRRLWLVARHDLAEMPRRPLYVLWALFLTWNGYLMSRGTWFYRSVDTSVGTQVSWFNSEFQTAFVMGLIGFLFVGFFVALATGMPLVRDFQLRVGELLHSTPLRISEYVWGKFTASLAGVLLVIAILVVSAMAFSHFLPDPGSPDAYGPFQARSYVMPALVFLVPGMVFLAGAALALGAVFGRAVLVFLLPVATSIFYNQFYWGWNPADMGQGLARTLQLTDPSGFRWLKQNWLLVDRGISFYNTEPVPYDAAFVASRLGFVVLGLLLVAWTARHLDRVVHGRRPGFLVRLLRRGHGGAVAGEARRFLPPLATLGMRPRVPGWVRVAWTVARFEVRELFAHPGLYIFLPVIFVTSFIVLEVASDGRGVFTPPMLLTSGFVATATFQSLNLWMAFLILFYAVESFDREGVTRFASIYHSTPIRTSSILLGKTAANAAVMLAIAGATFAAVLIGMALQGTVPVELKPFLIVWGLLFTPTFLLWMSFVTAVYALTNSRYATWGAALVLIVATTYLQVEGEMTWLTNWPLLTLVSWSDISVFELDRKALVLNRVFYLAISAVFAFVAVHAYRRRDGDAVQRRDRRPLLRRGAVLAVVPLVVGFLLWNEVHSSFQGDAARERAKRYWKQNLATWGASAEAPLPELVHVELDMELRPAERSVASEGFYVLKNDTEEPLPWMPVSGGFFWEDVSWTLDGKPFEPENRSGLYLFRFDEPLPPGATTRLGFRYRSVMPKGSTRNGLSLDAGEFILPSGLAATGRNPDFVPVVGFLPDRGVDEDNRYEPRLYPRNFHEGLTRGDVDRSPFTHVLRITAPAELTVNSTGVLAGVEERGDRRTWTWESDYPVRVFNVIAGRWEVRRGEGTAVFYYRGHAYNVDTMLEALDGARRHFSEWYYPYPWKELRLSEFPSVTFYARGNATNIFFSEGVGFLTRTTPAFGVDLAFMVAAHEAAHSWWGHVVSNGEGPGGIVLSEGGAELATLMLMDELRGPFERQAFARLSERFYGESRQPSSERPLAETTRFRPGDGTVIYNKGGWAFWMLMCHMGRDAFLDGVRDYFRTYHHSEDHPVIQDFVAVLRPYAPDTAAYDDFTEQWFFTTDVPEYRLTSASKRPVEPGCDDCEWDVHVEVSNVGTGKMPVDVAATAGRRFTDDGTDSPDYRDCRGTLTLGAGESGALELRCGFEPERVVVDPDVMVLQLQRQAASARLR